MKKIFLFSAMFLCSAMAAAQDDDYNPYAIFGYKAKGEISVKKTDYVYMYNTDTTAVVQTLAFDFDKGDVFLLNAANEVLDVLKFERGDNAIFISPDPHWYKYPSGSAYAYCGNDPVNRIDPTGMEWVDPDKDGVIAQEITTAMTNAIRAKESQISSGTLSEQETGELQTQIGKLLAGISELQAMGDPNNKQSFTFTKTSKNVGFTFKRKDGVIEMRIANNGKDMANRIHEASHGYDKWKGGLSDMASEVVAYERQFSYDASSLPQSYTNNYRENVKSLSGIDAYWVIGVFYKEILREQQGMIPETSRTIYPYKDFLPKGNRNVEKILDNHFKK